MPHTPGPWVATCSKDSDGRLHDNHIIHSTGIPSFHVATVFGGDPYRGAYEEDTDDCRLGNIALVAAAPDLLTACKEAETQFAYLLDQMASAGEWYPNADSECASRLKTLRAAIAKAGGAA